VSPPPARAGGRPFVVVDSSVSLKWALNDEEAVEQAVALRDDGLQGRIRMVAPALWSYEVANGLWVAARRSRLSFAQGGLALTALHALGVEFSAAEPHDCYAFAQRYHIAVYDAAYVALGAHLNTDVWTGDRKLYDAASPAAPWVRWIGDYRSRVM